MSNSFFDIPFYDVGVITQEVAAGNTHVVDGGSVANQNIASGYVTICTVPPPASGTAAYTLIVQFTNLNIGHALRVTEGGVANPPSASGDTSLGVLTTLYLGSDDDAVIVRVKDIARLCTSADWTWSLFEGRPEGTSLSERILTQVNKITTQGINVVSEWRDGSLRIIRGDAYLLAHGANRPFYIPKPSGAKWPDNLNDWTVYLKLRKATANTNDGVANPSQIAMTVVTATGDNQTVMLELTSAETADLAPGVGGKGYELWILAVNDFDDSEVTLVNGNLSVDRAAGG